MDAGQKGGQKKLVATAEPHSATVKEVRAEFGGGGRKMWNQSECLMALL